MQYYWTPTARMFEDKAVTDCERDAACQSALARLAKGNLVGKLENGNFNSTHARLPNSKRSKLKSLNFQLRVQSEFPLEIFGNKTYTNFQADERFFQPRNSLFNDF